MILLVLVLLLAGAGAGLFLTHERAVEETANGAAPPGGAAAATPGTPGRRQRLVDMRPLLAAKQLSALATTPEEQELCRQAERLADHAIDLAFVVAMRDAAESAPEQTPELRRLQEARDRARKAVEAAEARARELEARFSDGPERGSVAISDQIEVARAELELDRDELDSATDALQRAGGDPQARIRRLREVYDAAQKEPRPPLEAEPVAGPASSLLARLRAYSWQREKLARVAAAQRDIVERHDRLAKRQVDLTARLQREAAEREAARSAAARATSGGDAGDRGAREQAVQALARFRDDERRLAAVGQRLQDQQDLADTYGAWASVVRARARGALNALLWGVLALLGLLLVGFVAGEVVDRGVRAMEQEKARVKTLRTVGRLGVNVVVLLLALFMVFGAPAQATTVVGLAGAGLTVALKDFIVAFFGWFILMGRNGIRVGDWVEVKGVGGEVIEIGLFHTVLLETGSWTDAGHPTGRRVSFVNSFAIEGHYFNFSTSGQWMWDELRLLVPLGRDPYPVIDGVQHLVERETDANAKLAESEWRKSTSRYRVQTFSAVPGIQVVPTGNGIEVVVRYITRAHERHDARRRLYQAVLELMHGKRGADAPAADASAAAGGRQPG
jgi:small-conductance mechanosensitive channel